MNLARQVSRVILGDREDGRLNKKQKILTIVALVVFGAIIFFHYNSINYSSARKNVQFMTAAEKATAMRHGMKVTPKPFTPEEQAISSTRFRSDPNFGLERVVVEYPGSTEQFACVLQNFCD